MTENSSASTPPTQQELVITRIFDAPRELVFKAWTDPRHVARWWGPHGFTNPLCEIDARPGGAILIHMQGSDGVVIPTKGVFQEVTEPERLVLTLTNFEDAEGRPQLEIRNTVTFAEHEGKTKLTLRAVVVRGAPEVAASLASMEEGWNESLDRLAESLSESLSGNV
ncbi:MAG: SRPBCC family protein [Ktedonobacterales bacterium]